MTEEGARRSNPRIKLERILGHRIRAEAFVEHARIRGETVLLKGIRFLDGRIICDHLWVRLNNEKELRNIWRHEGQIISFSAETMMYVKKNREVGYGLKGFRDVVYFDAEQEEGYNPALAFQRG